MAPPPEYDKEPKAPDKSATTITNEDSKFLNSIIDQQTKSDNKATNTVANSESEKSKADDSVENLDDGRLRALLDEAITYKCPKDREGKSDLFKNLLEEAEQDDQASEAAARGCGSGGRARRGAGRRALPHSNSLQDLVAAALAAEPAPRRPRHHAHAHAPVSARATHGGSLPSGVDTSFLLGEEPARGGYLATVRCVNPPPLAERRVSASDANCPAEVELLHRRSKPVFPMTYTARATLEIGSGSVSSGRAVTTTTASNQVRTSRQPRPTFGPPQRLYGHSALYDPAKQDAKQSKLMNALKCPRNKNMSKPSESDLRGPRSDYENFGTLWSEITARYSPATISAAGINQPPKIQTAKPSTSTDQSSISSAGNKMVTPSICANPSSQKTLPTRPSATTYGNDTENSIRLASTSFGNKTQPASQIRPSNKNKITTSSPSVVPSIENKIAKPSTRNTSSSENKATNLLSQSRPSSQVNQTIAPIRQTMPSPEKRIMDSTHSRTDQKPDMWIDGVDKWYQGLSAYIPNLQNKNENSRLPQRDFYNKNNHNDKSDALQNMMNDTSEIDIHENLYSTSAYNKNTNFNASIDVYGTQTHWTAREKKLVKPLSNTITNCENEESYQNLKSSFDYEDDQHDKLNNNMTDNEESDIRLRKKYRNIFGHSLAVSSSSLINPRNVRPMSIGSIPTPVDKTPVSRPKNKKCVKLLDSKNVKNKSTVSKLYEQSVSMKAENCDNPKDIIPASEAGHSISKCYDRSKIVEMVDFSNNKCLTNVEENCQIIDSTLQQTCDAELIKTFQNPEIKLVEISQSDAEVKKDSTLQDFADSKKRLQVLKEDNNENNSEETELKELTSNRPHDSNESSFEQYNCEQQHFLRMLKETIENCGTEEEKLCNSNNSVLQKDKECQQDNDSKNEKIETEEPSTIQDKFSSEDTSTSDIVIKLNKKPQDKVSSDQYILAELPNNAYVFLTMPERLFTPLHNTDKPVKIQEISNDVSATVEVQSTNVAPKNSKKKKGVTDAKKRENITKTALKVLLFENIKRDSIKAEASSEANNEADSAIPFSCITTPEVVSSCNTTSSTSQSAVAVDPKPLQLGSFCRAVASLTGGAPVPASASAPAPALAASQSQVPQPQLPVLHNAASAAAPQPTIPQPRSVISSSFNGLSLSRPNYGSTASTAPDEYKKSLDENGNAVQGFSSPISGSSQHKKPRRKKSSKNETVIKSHQIDGYQGNKDLNEVLRFIESNAEHGRGAKLGRAKHDDDKAGKKRSTERRKDKESKLQRASSLEERSRTKLEDLTDTREPPRRHERKPRPDNKAERRSWGDDARDAFYYPAPAPQPAPEPEPDHEPEPVHEPDPASVPASASAPSPATVIAPPDAAVELTDFQTVTKRRKPRRRADEAEREPPRRPRPPSPRPRRESAPPSDRSNDSNDDLDSVHSLPPPPPPPPPAPHASYADIARTRHNIPDLIESCNFYGEGENAGGRRAADAPAAAGDADGYPALGGATRLARGKAPPRRERKERAAPTAGGECPAPDVVGDRRPAVILLDSAARPRDMDGVTFGFDINEQLLGAGGRRPRCDLVRDALAAAPAPAAAAPVAVLAGAACTPLRYLPPDPPRDLAHLHQIIDYVGNAWKDVVRCGGGKVRYFSE